MGRRGRQAPLCVDICLGIPFLARKGMPFSFPARHYRTRAPMTLTVEAGRFLSLAPAAEREGLPWIAPGLIDLQVNGFGGVDFNRPGLTPEAWQQACTRLRAQGCTGFLATLITHSDAETTALLQTLRARREAAPENCLGYHLEGPFLNPDPGTRGAHDPARMIPADGALFQRWNQAADGAIRLMTLAPEIAPRAALALIGQLRAAGVHVSIGHSAAMGETLRRAAEAGAETWTHLGNAVPRQIDKFENVLLHALAEERLAAFLIPDGLHLPPHAFLALSRALGPRLLLTTDAMSGADAPPDRPAAAFTLGAQQVELTPDGRAVLPGSGRLAGSTLTPFAGVFRAADLGAMPWAAAWEAFSIRPARLLGLDHGVAPGRPADYCLFTHDPANAHAAIPPRLLGTFEQGRAVWRDPALPAEYASPI